MVAGTAAAVRYDNYPPDWLICLVICLVAFILTIGGLSLTIYICTKEDRDFMK